MYLYAGNLDNPWCIRINDIVTTGHLMKESNPVENNNTVYDQQDAIIGTKDELIINI